MAAEWRRLPLQEKAYWEGIATNEKTRFAKERDALCKAHKGPLARKLRAKKDPVSKNKTQRKKTLYLCGNHPNKLTTFFFAAFVVTARSWRPSVR